MPLTNTQRLRTLLGEQIPTEGTTSDTMFSTEQIEDFLSRGGGDLNAAAFYGWEAKMGELANLVTTSEGNASRAMSDLHKAAKRMVDHYSAFVTTPGRGHARIGHIRRRTAGAT